MHASFPKTLARPLLPRRHPNYLYVPFPCGGEAKAQCLPIAASTGPTVNKTRQMTPLKFCCIIILLVQCCTASWTGSSKLTSTESPLPVTMSTAMDAQQAMSRLADYAGSQSEPTEPAPRGETIEERCFAAALICLESHHTQSPPLGPQTAAKVASMVAKTLEKTHTDRDARYDFTKTPSSRVLCHELLTEVVEMHSPRTWLSGCGSRGSLLQPFPA